jgi:hypothetical protein
MTPEERAAAVVKEDGGSDYYYEGWAREASIAAAIREAENDAIERAAVAASGVVWTDAYGEGDLAAVVDDAQARIRSLKHPAPATSPSAKEGQAGPDGAVRVTLTPFAAEAVAKYPLAINSRTGDLVWCGCGDSILADDAVCGNCHACHSAPSPGEGGRR